ncbi:hypothetical protein G6O69_00895 [Pseudenhygromyxa sp. WMMC2535]|uniref:hypothetical protein n=1 Tax=Pseudenhygromyxa sp. WMMC2535 TaxID=2712867 RepID=UPI001553D3F5|nr:hypothetical protein [Pseudenhygromyxa sp. WMMC2535]NVB36367.1 hypothetical protein [Pseudenhygromyxa sp. WMMC2535]
MDVKQIFDEMPRRYKAGSADKPAVYYFSIDNHKYTVKVGDSCVVEAGKTVDNADVILKTDEKIFVNMVVKGKLPGPIDIARGKIKTNDPAGLQKLKQMFDFG